MEERKLKYHHSSYAQGYIRVNNEWEEPYKGKFGEGIKRHERAHNTTRYHVVEYWIYEG